VAANVFAAARQRAFRCDPRGGVRAAGQLADGLNGFQLMQRGVQIRQIEGRERVMCKLYFAKKLD